MGRPLFCRSPAQTSPQFLAKSSPRKSRVPLFTEVSTVKSDLVTTPFDGYFSSQPFSRGGPLRSISSFNFFPLRPLKMRVFEDVVFSESTSLQCRTPFSLFFFQGRHGLLSLQAKRAGTPRTPSYFASFHVPDPPIAMLKRKIFSWPHSSLDLCSVAKPPSLRKRITSYFKGPPPE